MTKELKSLFAFGPFSVSWLVDGQLRWRTVYGQTPRKAIANARRIRRDYWLYGQDPGWFTTREQHKWTRLARRVGLV